MKTIETRNHRFWRGAYAAFLVALLASLTVAVQPSRARADNGGNGNNGNNNNGRGYGEDGALTSRQRAVLYGIARDTWNFYSADVDPTTQLPMDNIGFHGAPAKGAYTSPTNIGVYFWSIVSARDLHLIGHKDALSLANATLTTVEGLRKWHGFLLSWYDTTNGHYISAPNGDDIQNLTLDQIAQKYPDANARLISTVDNGWFASGLVILRQAFPELASRATVLLNAMNFSDFDNQTVNVNSDNQGQLCGGVFAGDTPATTNPCPFRYGMFNTEPRITIYMGLGTHTLSSDTWWRSWRTAPDKFDFNGQHPCASPQPPLCYTATYTDPQTGKPVSVFEGHYTYNGINYIPSWGNSMFEGLMPNLVVPETTWGTHSFGLNDRDYAQVQITYATRDLGYPVWGLSPSSTPDDTGNYIAYGAAGPPRPNGLSANRNCCAYAEWAVTPHASFLALDVAPQQAFANIQTLRQRYPDIYGPYGFFDAVAPKAYSGPCSPTDSTPCSAQAGQVGHRYLVLDQSMIMAALDNALNHRAMQRHFAADPVSVAAHQYLSLEHFSVSGANGGENDNQGNQ